MSAARDDLRNGTRVHHTGTGRRGGVVEGCFGTLYVRWDGARTAEACDKLLRVLEVVPALPDDRVLFNGRWRSRLDCALVLRKKLGRRTLTSHDPARGCYTLTTGTAVITLYGFPARVAALDARFQGQHV